MMENVSKIVMSYNSRNHTKEGLPLNDIFDLQSLLASQNNEPTSTAHMIQDILTSSSSASLDDMLLKMQGNTNHNTSRSMTTATSTSISILSLTLTSQLASFPARQLKSCRKSHKGKITFLVSIFIEEFDSFLSFPGKFSSS